MHHNFTLKRHMRTSTTLTLKAKFILRINAKTLTWLSVAANVALNLRWRGVAGPTLEFTPLNGEKEDCSVIEEDTGELFRPLTIFCNKIIIPRHSSLFIIFSLYSANSSHKGRRSVVRSLLFALLFVHAKGSHVLQYRELAIHIV